MNIPLRTICLVTFLAATALCKEYSTRYSTGYDDSTESLRRTFYQDTCTLCKSGISNAHQIHIAIHTCLETSRFVNYTGNDTLYSHEANVTFQSEVANISIRTDVSKISFRGDAAVMEIPALMVMPGLPTPCFEYNVIILTNLTSITIHTNMASISFHGNIGSMTFNTLEATINITTKQANINFHLGAPSFSFQKDAVATACKKCSEREVKQDADAYKEFPGLFKTKKEVATIIYNGLKGRDDNVFGQMEHPGGRRKWDHYGHGPHYKVKPPDMPRPTCDPLPTPYCDANTVTDLSTLVQVVDETDDPDAEPVYMELYHCKCLLDTLAYLVQPTWTVAYCFNETCACYQNRCNHGWGSQIALVHSNNTNGYEFVEIWIAACCG